MTIELPDINDFKASSFPGRWNKIGDHWGPPTTTQVAPIPPEVGKFHGRLGELVEQANELLVNKQNKSVEELQKDRDNILSEYNNAKRGYTQDNFTKMKVISDIVFAQQFINELNAVIEEKEKAIQDAVAVEKEKKKEDELKKKLQEKETERQVQEYINQAEQANNLIGELYLLPPSPQPTEKIQKLHEIMIQMDRTSKVIKYIAKKGSRSQLIYDIEGSNISDIYKMFKLPQPPDAEILQTRDRAGELKEVQAALVSGTKSEEVKPGDPSPPKTTSTSKCPCDSIKGGGKNKRKKNTKNKRKKNTKNKRKKYTKNKRKKNTKNKRKKNTKKKKSTKRKNVRNR